jgi:hypothetical protein
MLHSTWLTAVQTHQCCTAPGSLQSRHINAAQHVAHCSPDTSMLHSTASGSLQCIPCVLDKLATMREEALVKDALQHCQHPGLHVGDVQQVAAVRQGDELHIG